MPASSNAGRIANLADLRRTIRRISIFEIRYDTVVDWQQQHDDASMAASRRDLKEKNRQSLPLTAIGYIMPSYRK